MLEISKVQRLEDCHLMMGLWIEFDIERRSFLAIG